MKTSLLYLTAGMLVACCPVQKPVEVDPVGKNSSVAASQPKSTKPAKPTPYPLKTCLVSGEGLDSMDERVSTVYEGQVFEFCCKPCIKKFHKNPEKYQAMLAAGKSS
jgi:YHS domain-containing protein